LLSQDQFKSFLKEAGVADAFQNCVVKLVAEKAEKLIPGIYVEDELDA